MDAQAIQKASGVTDENLGRKTNAVSGEAIKARQLQGSVVTTEPFDNLRMTVQSQGQKVLSLIEQFYTEEKVLRLTGAQGGIEWVKVNQPEVQPDGSVRWINDVTSSMADFVVAEADYAGTLRQVMFDALSQISQRLPPEIALKLLRMAFEFSDLPNKAEIVQEIRRMTGEPDPNKEMSPEEQQQAQQQAQMQAEAMQIQREQAMAVLEEQRAKAREINARAEKALAEVESMRMGGDADLNARIEQAVTQVREQAATQIEQLSSQLAKMTASNEAAILKVRTDADTQQEVARIQANATVQVAEIERASDVTLQALTTRMEALSKLASEVQGTVSKLEKRSIEDDATDKAEAKVAAAAAPAQAAAPAAPADPAAAMPPMTINVSVGAGAGLAGGEIKKTVEIKKDKAGKVLGAEVTEVMTKVKKIAVDRDASGQISGASVTEDTPEGEPDGK
jgi:hypothetical protein